MQEDMLVLGRKDVKRLKVITHVVEGRLGQLEAGRILGLSDRQIRRMVAAVKREGDRGILHKLRGRPSHRQIKDGVKRSVLRLYQKRYEGFGATHFSEKLQEEEGIAISDETLRKWLGEAGLWHRQRRRRAHRHWRRRKEHFGEMVQMDGSHHAWLEDRGAKLVLMGYIDDATGNVDGRFYDYEGTLPAMDSFMRYSRAYGLPMSVYLDRHTTYKSTKRLPEGADPTERSKSQFERALQELGVDVIHAYSPQAKGRVERLFGILQDRLVKELRVADIRTREAANQFLQTYWPRYNRQFRVEAVSSHDVHIPVSDRDLGRCLCIKTERVVANDATISHHGQLYQIHNSRRHQRVLVEEHVDGSLRIMSGSQNLRYTLITDRPEKTSSFFNHPSRWLNNHHP